MTEPTNELQPDAEVAELQAEHDELLLGNNVRMRRLARHGGSIPLDEVVNTRLGLLLDALLGHGRGPKATVARMRFEVAFQKLLSTSIDEMETEFGQTKLILPNSNGNRIPRERKG